MLPLTPHLPWHVLTDNTCRLLRKIRRKWTKMISLTRQRWLPVGLYTLHTQLERNALTDMGADAKAKKELADSLKGKKGPINTGGQGIKKSGKK